MSNQSLKNEKIDPEKIIGRDYGYWKRVANDYDTSLTNPVTAEEGSIYYQEFEKEYVDKIINSISGRKKVALIEVGCGTGRFLKEFVSNERVKYLIGIDFCDTMLNCLIKNFQCSPEQIGRRVILIQGLAERTTISLDQLPEFKTLIPIVICVFNTLGNIENEERRIEVLKRIRDMIGERGFGVISVFNRELMQKDASQTIEFERYYYDERIEKLIVAPNILEDIKNKISSRIFPDEHKNDLDKFNLIKIDKIKGEIRTPDFYSHWFTEREIRKLIKAAELNIVDLSVGIKLGRRHAKAKRGIIAAVRRDK